MFEKIKLWMLTDENKEKYLLEKEKKERDKQRQGTPQKESTKGKEKTSDKGKSSGLFGKKKKTKLDESFDISSEVDTPIEEPPVVKKKKVVKKVVKKTVEKPTVPKDTEVSEIQQQMAKIQENNEKKRKLKEQSSKKTEELRRIQESAHPDFDLSTNKEEDTENKKSSLDVLAAISKQHQEGTLDVSNIPTKLEDPVKSSAPIESSTSITSSGKDSMLTSTDDSAFMEDFKREQEERKRKEKVKKKALEMDRFELVMLDLPPTNDMDKIIAYAVKAGVPEWYLKEKGYINDQPPEAVLVLDTGFDGENYEESVSKAIEEDVSIDKFKAKLESATHAKVSIDNVKETVQEVLDEEIALLSEELQTIENVEEEPIDMVEDTSVEVPKVTVGDKETLIDTPIASPIEDDGTVIKESIETSDDSLIQEEVNTSETPSVTDSSKEEKEVTTNSEITNDETTSKSNESLPEIELLPKSDNRTKKLSDLRAKLKGLQNAKAKVDAEYLLKKQEEAETKTETETETETEATYAISAETPIEPDVNDATKEEDVTVDVSEQANPVEKQETPILETKPATASDSNTELSKENLNKLLTEKIRNEMKEKAKAALQDSVVVAVEQIGHSNSVAERLKRLATKREVLIVEGNEVFVKEELHDKQGNSTLQYKRYALLEKDIASVNVGDYLDDGLELTPVESKLTIDGEDYDISTEEEQAILDEISKREVWVLSSDSTLVELSSMNVQGSRYVIRQVVTEKDFLLAIRSVNNVIVFTQQLPKAIKPNIVKYLKYLEEEKKKARIITVTSSPVKSKIIESSLESLSVEELDKYYSEHPSDIYNKSNKDLISVYKEISFDISKQLGKDIVIDLNTPILVDNMADVDLGDTVDESIIITIDEDVNPLENQKGDIEIELQDTVQIDDSDLY